MNVLEVKNLKKVYTTRFKGDVTEALRNVSFSVEKGEYVAIMGESGSGKTTLLNMIALIDRPTSGQISLNGTNYVEIKEHAEALYRRQEIGFVFQEYQLLDNYTVKENIILPLVLSKWEKSAIENRLVEVAKGLNITPFLDHYPYEISGGQRQRTAIGRAMINKPTIILADEPTGALDSRATDELLTYFKKLNEQGQTILMVTHSIKAASRANRILFIKDGEVFHQLYRGNNTDEQLYQLITYALTMMNPYGEQREY